MTSAKTVTEGHRMAMTPTTTASTPRRMSELGQDMVIPFDSRVDVREGVIARPGPTPWPLGRELSALPTRCGHRGQFGILPGRRPGQAVRGVEEDLLQRTRQVTAPDQDR